MPRFFSIVAILATIASAASAQPDCDPKYATAAPSGLMVVPADLNHDGRMDLVVLTNAGVQGWLQNSDGTFRLTGTFDTGGSPPVWMTVGDVNNDRQPDVLVSNQTSGNITSLLFGRLDGTFSSPLARNTLQGNVRLADFNGDGTLDVVTIESDRVNVFIGDGLGNFSDPRFAALGTFTDIAVG